MFCKADTHACLLILWPCAWVFSLRDMRGYVRNVAHVTAWTPALSAQACVPEWPCGGMRVSVRTCATAIARTRRGMHASARVRAFGPTGAKLLCRTSVRRCLLYLPRLSSPSGAPLASAAA